MSNILILITVALWQKIFERAVHNRIFQFLVDNDILFKHQFGFRPGHSTSHALINFVNKVANAVDCQKYLAGIFLDLSKAFDTLNHEILLSKLEACGITGTAHQWITDYFRNRIQYVQIDDSKSDALRQIICGVPQGPLFFIIYINDLPACSSSNELEFILFADDTSIFFEHSDLDVLTSHLNDQLHNVSTWLKANKLSINVKKTKLMIFRPSQKTLPITRQVIIENNVFEQVDNTKFSEFILISTLRGKLMFILLRLRPVSNVVLLPCRTKLIELNSTLARQ